MPRPVRRYSVQAHLPPRTSHGEPLHGGAGRAEAVEDATANLAQATSSPQRDPQPHDSCSSQPTLRSQDPCSYTRKNPAQADQVPPAIKKSPSANLVDPSPLSEAGEALRPGGEDRMPFRDFFRRLHHLNAECIVALRIPIQTGSSSRPEKRLLIEIVHKLSLADRLTPLSTSSRGSGAIRIPAWYEKPPIGFTKATGAWPCYGRRPRYPTIMGYVSDGTYDPVAIHAWKSPGCIAVRCQHGTFSAPTKNQGEE